MSTAVRTARMAEEESSDVPTSNIGESNAQDNQAGDTEHDQPIVKDEDINPDQETEAGKPEVETEPGNVEGEFPEAPVSEGHEIETKDEQEPSDREVEDDIQQEENKEVGEQDEVDKQNEEDVNVEQIGIEEAETDVNLSEKQDVVAEITSTASAEQQHVSRAIGRLMSDVNPVITGDFAVRNVSHEDNVKRSDSAFSLMELSSEESLADLVVEEVKEEEDEEVYVPIDREKYIEIHKKLTQEKFILRRKNGVLQKKLVEHFKKRRMDSALREIDHQGVDLEQKYFTKLYSYEEVKDGEEKERLMINTILKEMRDERNQVAEEFQNSLESLIERERQVGIGLINTKTGKPIPDRLVERLLNRQRNKTHEVSKVRLAYIKLRDKVAAKEAALRALETLGEGLHLMDYEQLRMENQSYGDKIEERDEELARLRTKATSSIQILAHVREKAHATAVDIDEVVEQLEQVELDVNNEREEVARLKHERDYLREETLRLHKEAGLLTKTRLLRDFEESIEETTRTSAQLQNLKNTFHDQKRCLATVRKSINMALSSGNCVSGGKNFYQPRKIFNNKVQVQKTSSDGRSIHKGKPSIYPKILQSQQKYN